MSALAKVSADLTAIRLTIANAHAVVAGIDNAGDAGEAYDQVKLAKEWARIRKVAGDVQRELLSLELHLLRKIGQLGADAIRVLPTVHRANAKLLAGWTDDQIANLVRDFGDGASPNVALKRWLGDQDHRRARDRFVSGDYLRDQRYVGDAADPEKVAAYSRDLHEGLAAILEHFYDESEDFSVWELAEQVAETVDIDLRSFDSGRTEGLLEVCRKAVRDAPPVAIAGTNAPRFVTCRDMSPAAQSIDKWIRVPFNSATLAQLSDMVALRQDQAQRAVAVAESLSDLLLSLEHVTTSDQEYATTPLGELAVRVAFMDEAAS